MAAVPPVLQTTNLNLKKTPSGQAGLANSHFNSSYEFLSLKYSLQKVEIRDERKCGECLCYLDACQPVRVEVDHILSSDQSVLSDLSIERPPASIELPAPTDQSSIPAGVSQSVFYHFNKTLHNN